jgi:hypothetical protein
MDACEHTLEPRLFQPSSFGLGRDIRTGIVSGSSAVMMVALLSWELAVIGRVLLHHYVFPADALTAAPIEGCP